MNQRINFRIVTLDWLRGIMALSIMFYHLSDFSYTRQQPLDSSDPLGRLGIYGVSVFFILSGLSMAIVYNSYFKDGTNVLNFYVRRIFRIWPLLWVVCILRVVFSEYIASETHYSTLALFLNFSTLFGFVKPTAYIAMGAWSIGNEMVYYALTPFIFMCYAKSIKYGNLLCLVTILIGILFSGYLLKPQLSLNEQWATYVNPFNNFFLYFLGIAMYYNLSAIKINQKIIIVSLFLAIVFFCVLPFEGDLISIVTGMGRLCFVLLSFTIVFCFYKMEVHLPNGISRFFESIGAATYGIYLFHPIVYIYIVYFFDGFTGNYLNIFFLVVPVSIIISLFSYRYFESIFVKLGKRLSFRTKLFK